VTAFDIPEIPNVKLPMNNSQSKRQEVRRHLMESEGRRNFSAPRAMSRSMKHNKPQTNQGCGNHHSGSEHDQQISLDRIQVTREDLFSKCFHSQQNLDLN
jgi:hypothetical protein